MSRNGPTGVLLINLGTPDSPDVPAVRRYLREFLSDPRVIDMPAIPRWFFLNLIILPFRPARSAKAYQSIWTDRGSPLLTHSRDLARAVAERLGSSHIVELGMRYGSPSIQSAVDKLVSANCERIIILPLFPQYASASTGSALAKTIETLGSRWNVPPFEIRADFFDRPSFINAVAATARERLKELQPERVLMSFHGLPEHHVQKSEEPGFSECDIKGPCPAISTGNRYCYRAQCYQTARKLAEALQLSSAQYVVAFQSRLGPVPWIQPYTDKVLEDMAREGIKKIAVIEPSFVADCLETVEEIGIRGREQWKSLGGEWLELIPCVNADPLWANSVVEMIKDQSPAASFKAANIASLPA